MENKRQRVNDNYIDLDSGIINDDYDSEDYYDEEDESVEVFHLMDRGLPMGVADVLAH